MNDDEATQVQQSPIVQAVFDKAATMTKKEVVALGDAWAHPAHRDYGDSAMFAALNAAINDAEDDPSRKAAFDAIWGREFFVHEVDDTQSAQGAWAALRDAVIAIVTWDLTSDYGPYTTVDRYFLIAPWVHICGMPDGLPNARSAR